MATEDNFKFQLKQPITKQNSSDFDNISLKKKYKEGASEKSFVSNMFDSVISIFKSDNSESTKQSKAHKTKNQVKNVMHDSTKFDDDLTKPYHELFDVNRTPEKK